MSGVQGSSVPPPGWDSHFSGALSVPLVPAQVAVGQSPAQAAVRWRIGAAVIDNFVVYGLYLLVCLLLHWQVANLEHLIVLLLLDVLYHFALESRDGQTIGKRRYGIRVVSVDDQPPTPKAIAMRSVLRIIDSLPVWYLSGLVNMVRTGPARRQRIGDVAAETKVVAVAGRAAASGTPRWLLPTATFVALALSIVATIGVVRAGHEPLTSTQQAQFVSGCENTGGALIDCQCLLDRLEADGYTSLDSLKSVVSDAQAERAGGQDGTALTELTSDALACRR